MSFDLQKSTVGENTGLGVQKTPRAEDSIHYIVTLVARLSMLATETFKRKIHARLTPLFKHSQWKKTMAIFLQKTSDEYLQLFEKEEQLSITN